MWKELDYGTMAESEKQMLVSEVNLLRELKHPNIVRYYDRIIDRTNTTLYIIMEHCEGGDLSGLIARCIKERWPLDTICDSCVSASLISMSMCTAALKVCVFRYWQAFFGRAVRPASHGTAHLSTEGVPQTQWWQGHGPSSRSEAGQHFPRHQTQCEARRLRLSQDPEPWYQFCKDVCWDTLLHVSSEFLSPAVHVGTFRLLILLILI